MLHPVEIRHVRKRIVIAAIPVVALLVCLVIVVSTIPITSERARRAVVEALSGTLDGTVDLEAFSFRLLPYVSVQGTGLTVRHHGRRDVPPLISIRAFAVTGTVFGLLRGHARHVRLDGLDIEIPPEPDDDQDDDRPRRAIGFVIDTLESVDARLAVLSSKEGHAPKVWRIHRLRMESVGNRPMPFTAVLTNAVPPGEIATDGTFGPWNAGEPGQTPLRGAFSFERADLSVFKGISGTLSSQGSFDGVLERIAVRGETRTPDFTVAVGGHPVPLRTRYRATIDGTNGDTILDRIDASFLDTAIVATGRVVDNSPGRDGRTVKVNTTIEKGRIEDVLRLAVRPLKPMVGALTLDASLVLPPGERDVSERLALKGTFTLADAHFTNVDVSRRIADLSRRTRGRPDASSGTRVASAFAGTVNLENGTLAIPRVRFTVPGAAVQLAGTYGLRNEALDFRGTLYADAKVSEMTTGIKSLLLKLVDPLFNHNGGSAIPIKVTGTRETPAFGLDRGRVFSGDTP
jgi:hypothetical protein